MAILVSGLFVAIVPATAAQADPVLHIVYCEEHRLPDGRRIVPCWHIDEVWIGIQPPGGGCLSCPPDAVQFLWSINVTDPVASLTASNVLDALHSLVAASIAKDPQQRAALRADAWKKYDTAAAALGQANLSVGSIWQNYKDGYGDPHPEPNLSAYKQYGTQTVLGLNLLRAAQANPNQAPQLRLQAQGAFDTAAAAFVKAAQP